MSGIIVANCSVDTSAMAATPAAPRPRRIRRLRSSFAAVLSAIAFVVAANASLLLPLLPTLSLPGHGTVPAFAGLGLHAAEVRGRRTALAVAMPGKYRALTRIRIRKDPDTGADPTGPILETGQVFEVTDVVHSEVSEGPTYLKVADHDGWIFDIGIAGNWVGKPIVVPVDPPPAVPAPAAAPAATSSPPVPAPAPEAPRAVEAEPIEPSVTLATAKVDTLRLPGNMLGAGFEIVRVEVQDRVALNFILGSGFPENALTPQGRDMLGDLVPKAAFAGGWLSAAAKAASKADLQNVRFAGTGTLIGTISGFETLDFPQAQLCSQLGIEVHGILGSPFFAEYDMDLDRYRGVAQFYQPGEAASQGFETSVRHLPGLELPSGNVGIAVRGTATSEDGEESEVSFIGLVDSSAAHTVLNWEAAKQLGFSGPQDNRLMSATKVLGAGVHGQPEEMPVVSLRLALCGVPRGVKPMLLGVSKEQFESSGGDGWYFERLGGGPGCVEMGAVNVAIGDVVNFAVLRDSKIGPFKGAAAVVGQDLLFQAQRVILNARDKQLWLEPGDIRDAPEM